MNELPKASPFASRSEFLVDQALQNALAGTPEQIRNMRPAASPQNPFPDRIGFRQNAWTVGEVFNIDRSTPTYRSWVSGMPVQPSIISDYTWEGSSRNAMSEGIW